jgi:hypothetical protein
MVDDNGNDLMKVTVQAKPINYGNKKCICAEVKHNHQPSCQRLATEDDGLCKGCHDLVGLRYREELLKTGHADEITSKNLVSVLAATKSVSPYRLFIAIDMFDGGVWV